MKKLISYIEMKRFGEECVVLTLQDQEYSHQIEQQGNMLKIFGMLSLNREY